MSGADGNGKKPIELNGFWKILTYFDYLLAFMHDGRRVDQVHSSSSLRKCPKINR